MSACIYKIWNCIKYIEIRTNFIPFHSVPHMFPHNQCKKKKSIPQLAYANNNISLTKPPNHCFQNNILFFLTNNTLSGSGPGLGSIPVSCSGALSRPGPQDVFVWDEARGEGWLRFLCGKRTQLKVPWSVSGPGREWVWKCWHTKNEEKGERERNVGINLEKRHEGGWAGGC